MSASVISTAPSGSATETGPTPASAPVSASATAAPADVDVAAVVDQVERNRAAAQDDVRVGPEWPLVPRTGAVMTQDQPDVAFDGTNFLVVWSSEKPSRPVGLSEVVATRVDPDGEVLDPAGVVLPSSDDYFLRTPSVTFDGGSYLVAYQRGSAIAGNRVGTDGVVHGSPLQISDGVSSVPGSGSHEERTPALASNGSTVLAVWEEADVVADPAAGAFVFHETLVGTRISGSTVLDPAGRIISQAPGRQFAPDVASDGNGFLVTWEDRRASEQGDVYGARVDGTGTVLDPDGFAVAAATGTQAAPAVAFGGSRYLVTWADDRAGGFDIRGARVTPAASVLDPTPLAVSTAGGDQTVPALAFDGTNFLAVWLDGRSGSGVDVYGTRVGQDGTVRSPSGTEVAGGSSNPTLPAVGGGDGLSLVAWGDGRIGGDVLGTRVDGGGTVLDTAARLISSGNVTAGQPAVLSNGEVTLVAWSSGTWYAPFSLATRIGPDGTILDPAGIRLGGTSSQPQIATDGTNFLVARNPNYDGYFCEVGYSLVSADTGAVLEEAVTGTDYCGTSGVVFDGTDYLVIVTDQGTINVTATVVSQAGDVLRSFEVTQDHQFREPSAAAVGSQILVAWHNGAALVDGDTVTPVVLPAALPEGLTNVASNGTGFLLSRSIRDQGVVVTRISADGTVLDPAGIAVPGTATSTGQAEPNVAFNGTWLLVWNDRRTTGAGPGVYGARIRSDGTVVDPAGFVIAPGAEGQPAVSAQSDGSGWTVAYPAHDALAPANQIFVREVAPK